jgi:HK97 family phage portal protein
MQGNKTAQNFLNELYANGLTANAVIKYTGDLGEDKKKKLLTELKKLMASDRSNRFIPLPLGMDITPLDLKLTDSQFFELKKFSSLQIAAAFGIKPNQINDYNKSSYANSESQNLSFYTDTLLAILTGWEEELNYKLLRANELIEGIGFKFNVASILRGDMKTQMEVLSGYTGAGIYQINEARQKAGLTTLPDGDVNLINGTFVKLEDIGKAYGTGKGGNGNA